MMDRCGVKLSVGVSGSGKTFGVMHDVKAQSAFMPIIVVDLMCEWTSGHIGVRTVAEADNAAKRGARLIILRPVGDIVDVSEEACAWAVAWNGEAGVCLPEAHHSFPNEQKLRGAKINAVCAWRHKRVALWCDTQRLPLLNRTVTEQATELRIYAVNGELDLKRVKEIGGAALVESVRKCARKKACGETGWHVSLDVSRLPPYRARKLNYRSDGASTVEYE